MTSVLPTLDSATFQDLVDDARASIPPLASQWTDFNISDPGIMLIELLAWTAEAQLYALGHVRRDERAAYSALMGVRARGPLPAGGLIWPQLAPGAPPPWGAGMLLPAQASAHAQRGSLPDFFLRQTLWLHGATLVSVVTVKRDGTRLDHTPVNLRRGGSFPVFGFSPVAGDRLALGLSSFPVPLTSPPGPQLISVGFRIRNPVSGSGSRSVASARFRATVAAGMAERELPIREDSTLGLAQTGVLLIECPVDVLASGAATTLEIELVGGELYPAPLAERIDLNVLSVIQQQQQQDVFPMGAPQPDQQWTLAESGVCFGEALPAVTVTSVTSQGQRVTWQLCRVLSHSGPTDTVYTFDPAAAVVQFGNGVNGAIPASGLKFTVSYQTSQGSSANVAGGIEWQVSGIAGVFGSNLDALAGGVDAEQLMDLQARARGQLELLPIVTDVDLAAAATALTGLRVVRAEIAPAGSAPPATRTLVVLRDRDPNAGPTVMPETPLWLEAVRRALSARLTLGQRLRVIAPKYVPVSVKASVTVTMTTDPSLITGQLVATLQARLALYASESSTTPWALGASVDIQSLRGWLRAVPGVLAVTGLTLTSGNNTLTSGVLALPLTGLPSLSFAASDITVTRTTTGSRR